MQQRWPVISRGAQDPAVSTGCHITTGPRIGLLYSAGGEDPLFLDKDSAGFVAALFVRPDSRSDVVNRIDDVFRPVIADHAVRPLGGVAANRQRCVDKEVQPIDRLFDPRAALSP